MSYCPAPVSIVVPADPSDIRCIVEALPAEPDAGFMHGTLEITSAVDATGEQVELTDAQIGWAYELAESAMADAAVSL